MMMMGSVLLCSKREIIFSRWGGSVRYFERERERERGLSNELLFHVSSLFLSLWLSSVHHFFQLLLEFSCSFELLFCNFRFCSIHLILSILAVNQIIVFQIHCSFFSFFLTSVHASPSAVDVIKYTIFMYKSCKHLDFMYFLTWDFQS